MNHSQLHELVLGLHKLLGGRDVELDDHHAWASLPDLNTFNINKPRGTICRSNDLCSLFSGEAILTHEQMTQDRLWKNRSGLDVPHFQGSQHLLHLEL